MSSPRAGRGGNTYVCYRCVGLQRNVDYPCEVRQVRAEFGDAVELYDGALRQPLPRPGHPQLASSSARTT